MPALILNDISFNLKKGEFLSLIGASGSGRTTLLKIIAGLQDVDSGKVLLKNEKITGPQDNLLPGHEDIKLVFQDFNLKSNMTVAEKCMY